MMRKNFITPKSIGSKSRCFVLGCKFEKFDRTDPERRTISTFHIPKKREVTYSSLRGGNGLLESNGSLQKYWAAFEKKTTPSNNSQRCPNLPPNSTAIYCQSTGPFPCLYCETVQPAQVLDPDLRDLVPDLPAHSLSSSTPQDKKPPLQKAVGKSLFNVVKNYFEKQETEDTKSSQKVVVIKCASTGQTDEELRLKSSANIEEKKLIVVKISSPVSQNTQESHLPENNTDLLEVLSNCTDLGAAEICEIVPSSHCKQSVKTPKSSITSKEDKTIRPKPNKPVFYNFQFEKKLVPVPMSFKKFHNVSKSTVDNSLVPVSSKPMEKVMSENSSTRLKKITPMSAAMKSAEEMASASEIKRRKLL